MKTYFIRHSSELDIDKTTITNLYNNGIIAIHYPWTLNNPSRKTDSRSINPEDYDRSGKSALRTLVEISKFGGFICAEYRNLKSPIIGYVEPNTPIELIEGVWGCKNRREGKTAILKTLKLAQYRRLDPADYVSLSVARPRQGTLVNWRSVRKRVENLVLNKKATITLNDLSADQQETMCAEFLRLQEISTPYLPKLETLLLPVGRTMKDVDIVGMSSNGKRIYAQVTYGKLQEYRYKIDRLRKFKDSDVELILFCRCDSPTIDDKITIFPIQKAFEHFSALEQGRRWFQAAT